ncbi:MAG: hypothetical protein JWM10_4291 [Myxococcaceae bacterium]|nr:hypothetical protein [Myxococcaceae bacterium]
MGSGVVRWGVGVVLAVVAGAVVGCASRSAARGMTDPGAVRAANEPDGSLLDDPEIVALLPPECAPATAAGECTGGCRWVANACRRVQGSIPQPE